MTCKDCLHDGVCFKQVCWKDNLEASLAHKGCESFADKSRFVEIVRCKNCKYYNEDGCSPGCGWCEFFEKGEFNSHFCYGGERKENEGD